jgi:hypothetical protein
LIAAAVEKRTPGPSDLHGRVPLVPIFPTLALGPFIARFARMPRARPELAAVLLAIVAACGGTTSGDSTAKGNTRDPSPPNGQSPSAPALPSPRDGFIGVDGDVFALFSHVTFDVTRFDGVALREARKTSIPGPEPCTATTSADRFLREAKWGNSCAPAPNPYACADDLACRLAPTGWVRGEDSWAPSYLFFVTVRRGVFTLVTTRAELLDVLGSIDTIEKALLLVALDVRSRTKVLGYRVVAGAIEVFIRGGGACSQEIAFEAVVRVTPNGTATEVERKNLDTRIPACFEGRRPLGLRDCPVGGIVQGLGDYLAEAAHLEAAAVIAFEQLANSLWLFGAPDSLLRRVAIAKADEARHADMMRGLAVAHGITPKAVDVVVERAHTLESLAIDNVIEGCVRETYAALRAMWQSTHATEQKIRAALSVIAKEEASHAELSWAVADWLETKLEPPARQRVRAARDQALEDLERELATDPHPSVEELAGMPNARTSRRLLREMVARLELASAA